ncbi:MAG: glycosyltransferase family 9 protein [Spirochaetota bacterium]|nr:glycosyltransferase family 9 protein [Spirochaetota bacterium]
MNYIIYQTAFIGDIILATSMAKTIRDIDGDGEIFFITTPVGEEILRNNNRIDRILVYDKRKNGLSDIVKIIKVIKERFRGKETVYISPHRFARASIIGCLLRSDVRVGFNASTLSFFYNRIAQYRYGIHELERNFGLISAVFEGVLPNEGYSRPELFPSEEDYFSVKGLVNKWIDADKNIISIAPGSVWATKRWPIEYFKELIRLLENHGTGAILIGGKEDQILCDRLTSNNVINLAGRLTILESAAAISLSRGIVTNDSAPLHIASAMNVPTLAIFGSTTPYLGFGPVADRSIVFENIDVECRPCGSHGRMKCRKKHFDCMNKIYPEKVFDELKRLI